MEQITCPDPPCPPIFEYSASDKKGFLSPDTITAHGDASRAQEPEQLKITEIRFYWSTPSDSTFNIVFEPQTRGAFLPSLSSTINIILGVNKSYKFILKNAYKKEAGDRSAGFSFHLPSDFPNYKEMEAFGENPIVLQFIDF